MPLLKNKRSEELQASLDASVLRITYAGEKIPFSRPVNYVETMPQTLYRPAVYNR